VKLRLELCPVSQRDLIGPSVCIADRYINKSPHGLANHWNEFEFLNSTAISALRIRSFNVGMGVAKAEIGVDQEVLPSRPFDGKCLMHHTNDHAAADAILRVGSMAKNEYLRTNV
jgi:hypothetical protein